MASLELKELRPGLVVAKQVKDLHGVLLIQEGTVLTEKNVLLLKSWGVDRVWVLEDPDEEKIIEKNPSGENAEIVEREVHQKFLDVLDDPVMVEIMRVAKIQLERRLYRKKTIKE